MAKRYGVDLEVLSSYERKPGTKVKEGVKNVEQMKIGGIAQDRNVARIAVVGVPDEPGIAFKLFRVLANSNINVDIILQSIDRNGTNDISFTVSESDYEKAMELVEERKDSIGYSDLYGDKNVAKVSIVGAGMLSSSGVAAMMFEALSEAKINIQMISTSEIKVSVLIDEDNADKAVQVIHNKFFN